MNNKRQTIWLVSMLSLMVVLSAFYLFTEDAPTNKVNDKEAAQQLNEGKSTVTNAEGVIISEVDQATDELTGVQVDGKTSGSVAENTKETDATSQVISPEDEAVIKGINNSKGNALLDEKALERLTNTSKKMEEFSAIMANNKVSQEESINAAEQLNRLEDLDTRITHLQEILLKDYDNAVVSEEADKFKVIVLSEKMDKKQAISIMDLATKELKVTPDLISVQYVQ